MARMHRSLITGKANRRRCGRRRFEQRAVEISLHIRKMRYSDNWTLVPVRLQERQMAGERIRLAQFLRDGDQHRCGRISTATCDLRFERSGPAGTSVGGGSGAVIT